jgi:hypothetical protein
MAIVGGLFSRRSKSLVFSAVNNRIGGAVSKISSPVSRQGSTSSVGAVVGPVNSQRQQSFSLVETSNKTLFIKKGNVSAKISNNAPAALNILEKTFSEKNKPNNVIQVNTTKNDTPAIITTKYARALSLKINNTFDDIAIN